MLSAMEPEFSRVIDPHLTWTTSSNGKRRAFRRARTFTQENRNKFVFNCVKDSEILDEDLSKKWDISVSESEKLGVSILGRRFSGGPEGVPIKKRRFSFLPCQSPPQRSTSYHNLENCPDLFYDDHVKQDELGGVCWGRVGTYVEDQTGLDDIEKQLADPADFSGISILAAAAACESNIERGLIDAEVSTVGQHPESQKVEEDHQSYDPEYGIGEGKPPMESSVTIDVVGRECSDTNSDECKMVSQISLQNIPRKRRSMPSSDDRLHWDLNKVMNVRECQRDEFSNAKLLPNAIVSKGGKLDCKHKISGPGQGVTSIGVSGFVRLYVDNQDLSCCFSTSEDIERKYENPTTDNDAKNFGFPQTHAYGPLCGEFHYKDTRPAGRMVEIGVEETKRAQSGQERFPVTGDPSDPFAVDAEVVRDPSLKVINVLDEGKVETSSVSLNIHMEALNTFPHQLISESASICMATEAGDRLAEDENITDVVHDKSMLAKTTEDYDHSVDCHKVDAGARGNHELISDIKTFQFSCIDVAFNGNASCSPASNFDWNAQGRILHASNNKSSQVLIDGSNSKNSTSKSCLSDETANVDALEDAYANTHLSKSLSFDSQLTSDIERISSKNACNSKYEMNAADVKVGDSMCCIVSDESLNAKKAAASVQTFINSDSLVEGTSDALPVDSTLGSQEVCRTSVGGYVRSDNQAALEEHLNCEYLSDAFPNGTDDANEMENVDFLKDDDFQYEDGELRESVFNSWVEDGAEEVETEHVDYGSDTKETDMFDSAHDFLSGSDFTAVGMECKNEENKHHIAEDHSHLKPFHNCINSKEVSNVSYGNGDVGIDILKPSKENLDANDAIKAPSRVENRLLASVAPDGGDVSGKFVQPARSRMKPSGWDKLPGSEDAAFNSVWKHGHSSVKNAGRYVGAVLHRDLSSRLEKLKYSETSHTKDISYARPSRKTDLNLNAERNSDACRSIGRSRWYFRSHVRNIDDHQEELMCSPDLVGDCYNATGLYSSSSFPHLGSRNAAAAAVAKVESNGFIVAPDGTIVKAGSNGPAAHISRRSQKSSTHVLHSRSRGSPIKRDGSCMSDGPCNPREVTEDRYDNVGPGRVGRYGSSMVNIGFRSYHCSLSDDRVESLPPQHCLSRSERSFSPPRRHLSCEHKVSPSRSRTRSPHAWTSPRGRNYSRINAVPDVRQQSRSPHNFNSDIGLERRRSPHWQSIPGDLASYVPLTRSHTSPLHTSRRIGGKRNMQDHMLEHQHRRLIGKSPVSLLRSNRLDQIDTHGRMKRNKYTGSMHSGRFHEYTGYRRGSKNDDQDDARTRGSNKYKMLHLERQHGNNGNMKSFQYDDDYNRSRNHHPKSSGLQWRESSKMFDRSIDAQHVHPPQRIIEERSLFGQDREGKPDSDLKSFGDRENGDDISLQRRSS